MRIATDLDTLARFAPKGIEVCAISERQTPARWRRNWKLYRAALKSDFLVVEFAAPELVFFAVLLTLTPFHRCRLVTLDVFLSGPRRWHEPLLRWSLNRVYRFLVHIRDTSALESLFGVPAAKFRYIPYKINSLELIHSIPMSDQGYIFSGGRSRRDFATFFAAVEELGYPVKLVTSPERELAPHGSHLGGLHIPDNVEILDRDPSAEFFVGCLAGARLVVIPLLKSTTQAGIAVSLQAMAACKCVIISSGFGVSDVLQAGQAIIVPAGDRQALRDAIERAWNDPECRRQYAEAGYRYAIALGGEEDLCRRVFQAL